MQWPPRGAGLHVLARLCKLLFVDMTSCTWFRSMDFWSLLKTAGARRGLKISNAPEAGCMSWTTDATPCTSRRQVVQQQRAMHCSRHQLRAHSRIHSVAARLSSASRCQGGEHHTTSFVDVAPHGGHPPQLKREQPCGAALRPQVEALVRGVGGTFKMACLSLLRQETPAGQRRPCRVPEQWNAKR